MEELLAALEAGVRTGASGLLEDRQPRQAHSELERVARAGSLLCHGITPAGLARARRHDPNFDCDVEGVRAVRGW